MISLAVVSEAQSDFRLVTSLVDRLVTESIDWIDHSVLDAYRVWLANGAIEWSNVPRMCKQHSIKVHGHLGGLPAQPDAKAAILAMRLIQRLYSERVNAILLIRDQDNQPERLGGLRQAVNDFEKFGLVDAIVVGFAVIERESWLLSGFVSQSPSEVDALGRLRAELHFDPTSTPELLTDGNDDSGRKSPKRVLKALTSGDYEREVMCIAETSLDVMQRNGRGNGLKDFIHAIKTYLLPLFTK